VKHFNTYKVVAVITLLPNPLKHLNTLRVEINPSECMRNGYNELFKELLDLFRKELGFSVSPDINYAFNNTGQFNVLEFFLPLYANEVIIAKDIAEELEKEEYFGKDSTLNRVTIKKELRK
jgi:hypothetical protein